MYKYRIQCLSAALIPLALAVCVLVLAVSVYLPHTAHAEGSAALLLTYDKEVGGEVYRYVLWDETGGVALYCSDTYEDEDRKAISDILDGYPDYTLDIDAPEVTVSESEGNNAVAFGSGDELRFSAQSSHPLGWERGYVWSVSRDGGEFVTEQGISASEFVFSADEKKQKGSYRVRCEITTVLQLGGKEYSSSGSGECVFEVTVGQIVPEVPVIKAVYGDIDENYGGIRVNNGKWIPQDNSINGRLSAGKHRIKCDFVPNLDGYEIVVGVDAEFVIEPKTIGIMLADASSVQYEDMVLPDLDKLSEGLALAGDELGLSVYFLKDGKEMIPDTSVPGSYRMKVKSDNPNYKVMSYTAGDGGTADTGAEYSITAAEKEQPAVTVPDSDEDTVIYALLGVIAALLLITGILLGAGRRKNVK